jgi:hypothetical protein
MADRSINELRTEIAEGWRQHEADVPRGVRWDDWSDEDRRNYDLKVMYEGMNYGFFGLRLSQAGETLLRSVDTLNELAQELLARIKAAGQPVASGWVVDAINAMARERSAA